MPRWIQEGSDEDPIWFLPRTYPLPPPEARPRGRSMSEVVYLVALTEKQWEFARECVEVFNENEEAADILAAFDEAEVA